MRSCLFYSIRTETVFECQEIHKALKIESKNCQIVKNIDHII
jgi:hypothetical protein